MEQTFLAAAFSVAFVVVGGFSLLVFALVVIRRLTATKPLGPTEAPIDSGLMFDAPADSVVIAYDYEREARPTRERAYDTPTAMPAIDASDSFEALFERAPSVITTVSAFARTAPLPMPIAPPGLEPIPELEPTELITHRPEWAAAWP